MSQERLKVLELLSAGTINAEQAAELLQNLSTPVPPPPPEIEIEAAEEEAPPAIDFQMELQNLKASVGSEAPPPVDEPADTDDEQASEAPRKPTKLRIRVSDSSGKQRADIGIPFKLLKFGISIGERFAPEFGERDWQNLDIDIEDGDGHVRIFVE
ncbi:MAG: SHOCT-like domain-containing protein [Candidatus Promineifilaceae bacterium]